MKTFLQYLTCGLLGFYAGMQFLVWFADVYCPSIGIF